jgi:hypothetical protein
MSDVKRHLSLNLMRQPSFDVSLTGGLKADSLTSGTLLRLAALALIVHPRTLKSTYAVCTLVY